MRDDGERCDHAVFVILFSNQRPVDGLDIDGFYSIVMDRFVTNCSAVVTRADLNLPRDLHLTVRHFPEMFSANTLFVNAFNDLGVSTRAAFDLVVVC